LCKNRFSGNAVAPSSGIPINDKHRGHCNLFTDFSSEFDPCTSCEMFTIHPSQNECKHGRIFGIIKT
jgi:hypothetical protein